MASHLHILPLDISIAYKNFHPIKKERINEFLVFPTNVPKFRLNGRILRKILTLNICGGEWGDTLEPETTKHINI